MTPSAIANTPISAILKAGKAAMLLEPMADLFNDLPMVAPVRRIMIVAENLAKASAASDTIRGIVQESAVIGHLRTEGRLRGNGDVIVPGAFVSDFDRVVAREVANG